MLSNVALERSAHFPKTLGEFRQCFPDDGACAAFLEKMKWPAGFVCPHCGQRSDPIRLYQRPELLHCSRCGGNVLTTAGSVMTDRVIPLSIWFLSAYLLAFSLRDVGSHQLCLPLMQEHHEVLDRALALLRHRLQDHSKPLGHANGCGHVEVAASTIQYDAANGCSSASVAAAVEVLRHEADHVPAPWNTHCAGRLRLGIVPNLGAEAVCSFLHANVDPAAAVFTKTGATHTGQARSEGGTSKGGEFEVVRIVLNSLECWCRDYIDLTGVPSFRERLDEFTFRFNRGFDTFSMFQSLLGIECHSPVPLYREIALNEWKRSAAGMSN